VSRIAALLVLPAVMLVTASGCSNKDLLARIRAAALLAPVFPTAFREILLDVQLQHMDSQYIESQPHAEIFAVELVALQLVTLP